jgi:hypothetical protein
LYWQEGEYYKSDLHLTKALLPNKFSGGKRFCKKDVGKKLNYQKVIPNSYKPV